MSVLRRSTRPRRLGVALVAAALAVVAGGCVSAADPTAQLYHHGELSIGTSNTTGVFYEIGAGYAAVINKHLPGYEMQSAPTNGSVDNLQRIQSGDVDLALAFTDNAADALHGTGPFAGKKMNLRAIARLYLIYTHLIVRNSAGINSLADLRGKKISTGPKNSGSEAIALRILGAVDLVPNKDVTTTAMSLPQETSAIAGGKIDAMFYSSGLPLPGVSDLFSSSSSLVHLVPLDSVLPKLDAKYGSGVYTKGTIPKSQYDTPTDVATVAEYGILVVRPSMPDDLVYNLTRLLFEYQSDLAAVHPAANGIQRDTAPTTDPVPLHPGAERYYRGG
jgi:TRAP transporter TAXI family solute receptor